MVTSARQSSRRLDKRCEFGEKANLGRKLRICEGIVSKIKRSKVNKTEEGGVGIE
ncbi:hypothetical protein COLO4_34343 [Corchorus olitorius]|uniref:Uncharacterized protein n=1 Tax=Corchorus olitorius TaxID=93759 RepID=A0A1R3GLG7_9ROSI|nr:hypothetical protein COLO4_34343 [Corchorus olitorius]